MLTISSYFEAVNILYAHNSFDFFLSSRILQSSRLLLDRRFRSIRYLNLRWLHRRASSTANHVPDKNVLDGWNFVWGIFASMEKLKELRVEIGVSFIYQKEWILEELEILEPVKQIIKIRILELVLLFPSLLELAAYEDLPCNIIRVNKHWTSKYDDLLAL